MTEIRQSAVSLKESFDKIADSYDGETSTLAHKVSEFVTMENLMPILKQEPVKTVLDAGGGTGKWAMLLAAMGYQVTLIDISPKSLDIARRKAHDRKLSVEIVEANAERTSLGSASFDFILSQGPMSYTPNPSEMIQEMSRVMKPNGRIWLDFYNTVGWAIESADLSFKVETILADERLIQMPDWDYPARVFSIRRVAALCSKAGLSIEATYGNHILMSSLPLRHVYAKDFQEQDLADLKKVELKLSREPECVGASKACQVLARKTGG